jgi:6-phosphofructokinase 1
LKADPEVFEFMKRVGMFAPGIYVVPEVREVTPGHLVRSGQSSAFDVVFGQRAGAVAVFLLLEGKTGNTVVNVVGEKVYYMPTAEAIKRREVDLEEIALFESLGTCFGRRPEKFHYRLVETMEPKRRHV